MFVNGRTLSVDGQCCVFPGQKKVTDINSLANEYLRLCHHGLRTKDKLFKSKVETDF
jgi:hypothetical protein